jgi:glycosyltransferase involved in cell wall biosynthesis
MSTYNSAPFVVDAIHSVLNQSMDDLELLVIDDGSTDTTVDVVRSIADARIRLIKLPINVGVGSALNFGLSIARSPYLAKVDADDINHPERFSHQLAALTAHPEWGLVKGSVEYFTEDRTVSRTDRYRWLKTVKEIELNAVDTPRAIAETLPDWCCIAHNTVMARTQLIQHYGYPPWRMGEDYALFYRMNQDGLMMGMVDEAKVGFRVSESSTTGSGVHQLTWVSSIYALKRRRLQNFIAASEKICIVGGGQLATGLKNSLNADGITVQHFLKWKDGIFSFSDSPFGLNTDGFSLENCKILVACQPVRQKVCSALEHHGLQKNKDYLIFA